MSKMQQRLAAVGGITLALGLVITGEAIAAIQGLTGSTFNLTAKADYITTGDANQVWTWSYADGAGLMQYPGPTLIVTQGDLVTIKLTNNLPVTTSMVFPGQTGGSTSCDSILPNVGTPGLMTCEAVTGATVTYSFTAGQPGTYLYQSGTQSALQVEMGMVGALIVRPAGATKQAYGHADTAYDREYIFLITEMDPNIHDAVAAGNLTPDLTNYFAVQWYINGRNGLDTLFGDNVPQLPNQPYGALALAKPGEKVLARVINAGRDLHPFHFHGNNVNVVARDGRLLESAPGVGADLAWNDFTIKAVPGATYDALFSWTGKGLGWDIYNNTHATKPAWCNANNNAIGAYAGEPNVLTTQAVADRCKPIPVALPNLLDLTVGMAYSGSPYLGVAGALPPGEGGFNPFNGYFYMWHSHTEKELTNNDIFPGGLLTMMVIVPPSFTLPTE
jgi:hypothetical protein